MTGTTTTAPFEYGFHVPRDPRAVGVTRTSLGAVLTAHEIPELIDRAQLLASELLTNAIVHARSAAELRLTWAQETLRLAVWDAGPESPEPVDHPGDGEHGRGLHLLTLLADRWDHFPVCADLISGASKVVWCEISRSRLTS